MPERVVRQEDEDFGKDHGLIHEAIVTGRKVGAGRKFWKELAHNERLFAKVVRLVQNGEFEATSVASGRLIDISDKVELLIRAGYHQVTNSGLGMPASAYRKLWPRTVIQPMEYVGRFDEELLVDRTIAKFEHVNRGNIYTWVNPADCTNLAPVVAASWYIAFVQLGKKNLGRPVEDCTKTFASDEVGLVTVEGLHLPVQHADYLRNYAVDLAGSRYESVSAPYVYWFDNDRPNFNAHDVRNSNPNYGSASRGSTVITVP